MNSKGRFSLFVDRPTVKSRVSRKVLRIITRVGAFGRTVMKRKYRRPLSATKLRSVTVNGNQYHVQLQGLVLDAKTGRPARGREAMAARIALAQQTKGQGAGLPPRRGQTDKLYKFTDFGIDPQTETAVIGAFPFAQQPAMQGAVSVPELLDKGGGEFIGGLLVKYDDYPFTAPSMPPTYDKLAQLIESVPL